MAAAVTGVLLDVIGFLNRIWSEWHIGLFCALVSMAMVFTTDARLVRQFVASGRSFRAWVGLAVHTAWRVVVTVCLYYGPGWTLGRALDLLAWTVGLAQRAYLFVITLDRWHVVVFTTSVIVGVFLWQTSVTLWRRYKAERRRR